MTFPPPNDPAYYPTLSVDRANLDPTTTSTVDFRPVGTARYSIRRLHAVGGIGQVWIAHDDDLGREVALKELRPQRDAYLPTRMRFLEEARITGQLEHPNIVPVYELVRDTPRRPAFYTMRFLKGRTLSEAAKEYHEKAREKQAGVIELRGLLSAFLGVCNAVAYAHDRGVIHRDLKGANVLLGSFGEVVLLDWGLAKVIGRPEESSVESIQPEPQAGRDETSAGQVIGTPAYMPPEQAAGKLEEIDRRSDVYGLGAILFEILTGRAPYVGADTKQILSQVLNESPPRPRDLVPSTPRALEAICLKALSRKPADRYAAVTDLIDDVQRYLADEPVSVYREPPLERFGRRLRHNRTLAAALAVAAAILIPALAIGVEVERRNNRTLVKEQEQTKAAQLLAEDRFEQAIDTWHAQVITAQNELDSQLVSPRFRLGQLELARRKLTDLLGNAPRTPQVEHMFYTLHSRMAEAYLELADRPAALKEWEQAHAIAERLVAADPDGPDARRDLANSYRTLGNVRSAEENWPAAIAAYREAELRLEAYAAVRPEDARATLDRIALAHDLGRALLRTGDAPRARVAHESARDLARVVVDRLPDDPRARDHLQLLARKVSDDLRRAGNFPAALESLTEALTTLDRLVERDPDNQRLARERSAVFLARGDVEVDRNRLSAARDEYRKALEIRDQIARRPGALPVALMDLAVVHERLGTIYLQMHQPARAAGEFAEQVQLNRRLVMLRKDALSRYNLSNALVRLGNARQQTGELDQARKALTECLTIREELAAAARDDVQYAVARAETHAFLGLLERDERVLNVEASLEQYRKGLTILEPLERAGRLAGQPAWMDQVNTIRQNVSYVEYVLRALDDPEIIRRGLDSTSRGHVLLRARILAKRGKIDEAVSMAEEIAKRSTTEQSQDATLFDAARAFALTAVVAGSRRDELIDRSLELLARVDRQPLLAGWKDHADLEPLRGRAEFQVLIGATGPAIPLAR